MSVEGHNPRVSSLPRVHSHYTYREEVCQGTSNTGHIDQKHLDVGDTSYVLLDVDQHMQGAGPIPADGLQFSLPSLSPRE
jgi:hypothetical protein